MVFTYLFRLYFSSEYCALQNSVPQNTNEHVEKWIKKGTNIYKDNSMTILAYYIQGHKMVINWSFFGPLCHYIS